jgi:PAS domain S-box-containing protein
MKKYHNWIFRITIIFLLIGASAGLGIYFHTVLHTDIVYTHFLYIPIVLAGMWWGRKGILVALALAVVVLSFHLFGIGIGPLWSDVARIIFFAIVAFFIGSLQEQVLIGQEALLVSEGKYRLLIDNSLTGIFVYRDDKILFANSQFSEIMAFNPQELIGKSIWELFFEEDRPKVRDLVAKRKGEGVSDLHYECRFVREDGTIIWGDVASSVANYEGEPAVLVNVYDITEKKEAEEKRQQLSELAQRQEEQLVHSTRLAELGEMAAAISHELNQPLTGIRNFARNAFYMIEQHVGSPEEIKSNLRLISEQVDRASKIIKQMRELTRKSDRHFVPVNINSTIRESVEFLVPQMKLSGVQVRLELSHEIPEILGDRIRLEQVFLNLLTNARQAMEDITERRLVIKTSLDEGSDYPIVIEIADTGKGFTAEETEKLFRPFFTTKKTGQGTGLGLSISLSIIREHKGTIEAVGEPGKGATFTIRLPKGGVDENE